MAVDQTTRIRAERRAGELLTEMPRQKRGRSQKTSHDATISDLGISKDQSSHWQAEFGLSRRRDKWAMILPG
jgi:hypothetical protein